MKRTFIGAVLAGVIAGAALLLASPAFALPDYTAKTGAACGACHVNPAGGGLFTGQGAVFAKIATHVSDPASAWKQATAPAPAAPAAVAPVASAPAAPPMEVSRDLVSNKVSTGPKLDGVASEDYWAKAKGLEIPVAGGANVGSTTVTLKSVRTDTMIYFLAQWADPEDNKVRAPWQMNPDRTWTQLKSGPSGDDNKYYEDKFAMIWNINDSIKGFNQQGCSVTCHLGEGKHYGNKYTASEGELGDIWHWKRVRTNPVFQIDDQYVDWTRYDPAKAPEAGRKSDPRSAGGYNDNVLKDGMPQWTAPQQPASKTGVYWLWDDTKLETGPRVYDYKPGDQIAGIAIAPFQGDRADLSAYGVWAAGKWTLEWGRKLDTGSKTDVQFTDPKKDYYFGAAVFDNAQVRHSVSSGAYRLMFEEAAPSAPAPLPAALPKTGGPSMAGIIGLLTLGGGLLVGLGLSLQKRAR